MPFVMDEDADAGPSVPGVEIEEVDCPDGFALRRLDDQPQLAGLGQVEPLLFDELHEHVAGERGRGAAHGPDFGVVFPAVHRLHVLGFDGPQAANSPFEVHQIPMILLRMSIATPQALAFSVIFERRNFVSLKTRLSEYLLVEDFSGSMM